MIGKLLLNYQITSLIGEGGMGNVYLGEHASLGRKVAIKVLRPELSSNEEIRKRFKNEAKIMASLQHQGIVTLYDYHEDDDGLYLIMEYVEGQEVNELLKNLDQPLSIVRAKKIMKQVIEAFSYAHKKGIVHRDVKPANILVDGDDNAKVLDFGIAKLVGDTQFNLTKTGTQVGTVYYMSPEQVKAKGLDHRSDIYSLGVTFYELLSGFCPYKTMTSEYEVYEKIVKEPLLPLTDTLGDVYSSLWEVIKKATAKQPEDRYQTCQAFLDALESNNEMGPPIPQRKESPSPTLVKEPTKKKGKILLVVGLSIAVLAACVVVVMNFSGEDTIEKNVDGSHVLIASMNFRDGNSIDANEIGNIPFSEEVELIGEPLSPVVEDDYTITWQQAEWKGKKGWLAIEIDSQPTIGSIEDVNDIKKLIGGSYNQDGEFGRMRIWAQNEIIAFLNDKNWIDKYHFIYADKSDRKKGYRALIKYHNKTNYDKSDPYDYVIMLESDTDHLILFLSASVDDQGGEVVGWTKASNVASYLKLMDSKTNSIGVFDGIYRLMGKLDTKEYEIIEAGIESVQIEGEAMQITDGVNYYESDGISYVDSQLSIENGETQMLCYDSFSLESICIYGSGPNLELKYIGSYSNYVKSLDFTITGEGYCFNVDRHELNAGKYEIYSGSTKLYEFELEFEGCL